MALAAKLAKAIHPPQLIELVGDLGGGKTTFVQAMAKALGITKTVTSPTFAIHQSYEVPAGGSLEHFDLYRLTDDEIVGNELRDALAAGDAVVCVEWAQHFHSALTADRLIVQFEYVDEQQRQLTIQATGPASQKLVEALQ